MSEDKKEQEPTLVEKWIRDQQEWQKTTMEYFDSMVKNDDFLVHLGNAMRGSLLAGKPYPGTEPAEGADEIAEVQNRIDEVLHALHKLQGDLADLKLEVDDLKSSQQTLQQRLRPAPARTQVPTTPANPASGDSGRGED